ncbi:MAG: hypothetical protein Q9162_007403 [Coniocarpon cinnabarinum]
MPFAFNPVHYLDKNNDIKYTEEAGDLRADVSDDDIKGYVLVHHIYEKRYDLFVIGTKGSMKGAVDTLTAGRHDCRQKDVKAEFYEKYKPHYL